MRKKYFIVLIISAALSLIPYLRVFPGTQNYFNTVMENTPNGISYAASSELEKTDSPLTYGTYSPGNLFDNDEKTCWCEGEEDNYGCGQTLYFSMPYLADSLTILNGYHKSEDIYYKNSRLKKAEVELFIVLNIEGNATQTGLGYRFYSTGEKTNINFNDEMKKSDFPLNFNYDRVNKLILQILENNKQLTVSYLGIAAALTIQEIYKGSKYKDTCISEISFPFTEKLSINKAENTITCDKRVLVSDPGSVFQLIDRSKDNRWAIVIRMPAVKEGRAETEYRLYYLPALRLIKPSDLNIKANSYLGLTDIYGSEIKQNEHFYLHFLDKSTLKKNTVKLDSHNLLLFYSLE